jgi:hypothetical protein
MKTMTIRRVEPGLAQALERERRRRGASLNQTVLDLLSHSLGVGHGARRSNGLSRLAGTWSEEEAARFDQAMEATEQIDRELWR